MTTMASLITSLTVVYSTVYSEADQTKHQSSASLAFVWGIHRDRWIPRTKGQLRGKCFHLMTSSCFQSFTLKRVDCQDSPLSGTRHYAKLTPSILRSLKEQGLRWAFYCLNHVFGEYDFNRFAKFLSKFLTEITFENTITQYVYHSHDDVIKWKHFPRNWPFVRGIHRSRWIPHTKASDAELWCFLWSASE